MNNVEFWKNEFAKEYLSDEERDEVERGKFTEIPDHDCITDGESGCDCSFMREGD